MVQGDLQKTEGKRFGEERALYGSRNIWLKNCAFDGKEDGESALKESQNIVVEDTYCNLRYPFWHDQNLTVRNCELTALCRAALWYSEHIQISDSRLHGIKALRECSDIQIDGCDIVSAEFGWSAKALQIKNSSAEGEYFLLRAADVCLENVTFSGKYSFQYVENGKIENCRLDTKDAFWHAKNLTVCDSVVKGEYLGWYSENITFIRCKIIGTQPLCYCKNLRLIDCEMQEADLSFEKSEVNATLTAPIVSIKNPYAGEIRVPAVREIIQTDKNAHGRILVG